MRRIAACGWRNCSAFSAPAVVCFASSSVRRNSCIDNGVRVRRFTPGGSSVVSVANGVADQHAGWKGREFVIETSGRERPTIVERYALSAESPSTAGRM